MHTDGMDMPALGQVIRRKREERGWTAYRLAKRAGVSDVYLRDIEDGKSKRVGIEIVARLAHSLGVSTDSLLAEIGLGPSEAISSEVGVVYDQLGDIERRAWLRMGHTLREVQEEYEAMQEQPEDDSEPDEPPSLHPPGTMGHLYPPAADTGEDLRRAENRRRYDEEQRRKRQAGPEDS